MAILLTNRGLTATNIRPIPAKAIITMSESFAELFEESLAKTQMRPGAIITGTIVKVDNDFVTVNAGLKSEGVIPISQFF